MKRMFDPFNRFDEMINIRSYGNMIPLFKWITYSSVELDLLQEVLLTEYDRLTKDLTKANIKNSKMMTDITYTQMNCLQDMIKALYVIMKKKLGGKISGNKGL